MQIKKIYYLVALLLAFILFASNFLSTELFKVDVQNFTVWFVLSLFAFVCGWLINKVFGWKHGGKVVFAVIIATVFISLVMVILFNAYFGVNRLLTENLVLYPLRNIMLGAMGFFGMTIAELLHLQAENSKLNEVISKSSGDLQDGKKEAFLIISEAKVNAEKLIFDAERKAKEYEQAYRSYESKLKELVQMEKEVIRQYEEEDKLNN